MKIHPFSVTIIYKIAELFLKHLHTALFSTLNRRGGGTVFHPCGITQSSDFSAVLDSRNSHSATDNSWNKITVVMESLVIGFNRHSRS